MLHITVHSVPPRGVFMRILIRTKPKETAGGNVLQQMLTAYEVFDYIYDFPVFFLLLSKCHDYIRKLNLYADAGAREYWIVDPMVKESQSTIWKRVLSERRLTHFRTGLRSISMMISRLISRSWIYREQPSGFPVK